MKKYLRVDWDFVNECKLFYFWNNFGIRTWMIKYRCSSCYEKTREYILFQKVLALAGGGDFFYANTISQKYCPDCFFRLEKEEWEIIQNRYLNKNKFIKNKCYLCKSKNKENVDIMKNSASHKRICLECWNREKYEDFLSEEYIKESKKFFKELFGSEHEENNDYLEFDCECDDDCDPEECECNCHLQCSCKKICRKVCKCLCHNEE